MELVVKLEPDAEGYTGRECPTCKKYFKVKDGTGLPGSPPCHCPYCNHVDSPKEFFTEDQIEYAQSVAVHKFSSALLASLKKVERRPDSRAFISIGITVKGSPTPIIHYSERELEERVTCSACTLQYTIYGAFGFCPDCGVHNSLQIANANLDLVVRTLDLAKTAPADVATKLVENALEDAVSCFDGFGREHCSALPYKISFQNIEGARDKLLKESAPDIAAGLDLARWRFVCAQFQKRHLLAHKMGIIDAEFIARTGASPSLRGRKISISEQDVRTLVDDLRQIANTLYRGIPRP
jgi:hypothetical protein